MAKKRCSWAETHEDLISYHDTEWGVPVHEDQLLFEMLNLEGAQAGLSWVTVLKKRASYQDAFGRFDAKKIVLYSERKKSELLKNKGIIRNRLKIQAVIENARAYLNLKKEGLTFDQFLWAFVDNQTLVQPQKSVGEAVSLKMSQALRKRGFKFVGPTICYAFMQGVGMVDDHASDCFRFKKRKKVRHS